MLPEHLSYSSINLFLNCPRQWKYKYILKRPVPTSEQQLLGTAIHQTVQGFLVHNKEISLIDTFEEEWKTAQAEKEISWKTSSEAVFNEGVRLLTDEKVLYGLNALSLRSPDDVERKISLNVPGVPVPVIGYIDWFTADGMPCDLKTSARSWTQSRADNELQPVFYMAALHQAGQPAPAFQYTTLIKTKQPKLENFTTTRTNADFFWLFKMIKEVWDTIYMLNFPPNPTTWMCSQNNCAFWAECRR